LKINVIAYYTFFKGFQMGLWVKHIRSNRRGGAIHRWQWCGNLVTHLILGEYLYIQLYTWYAFLNETGSVLVYISVFKTPNNK